MTTVNRVADDPSPVNLAAHWRTVAASAARATGNTENWDLEQNESQGVVVVISVSALTSAASLVFKIQGVDPVSGATWDIITSAAVIATGTTVLKVHPGITLAANVAVADALPPRIRVNVVPADNKSVTYSIAANFTA